MQSKGTRQIAVGLILLAATVFVLPTPLFEVSSGIAGQGAVVMFAVGLGLLLAGLGFVGVGLRKRSRNLRTPRTYDTREPSSSNEDRPVNPHAVPHSYGAVPPLI
jgi:ABC-type nickel/cobalt efflux system permease component RcnA